MKEENKDDVIIYRVAKKSNGQGAPGWVIALIIALVVVFVGVPVLLFLLVTAAGRSSQNSQMDAAAKNDVNKVLAAINDYKSSNRGRSPATIEEMNNAQAFFDINSSINGKKYVFAGGKVASGETRDVSKDVSADSVDNPVIHIYFNSDCSSTNSYSIVGGRGISAAIKLPASSKPFLVCE